MFFMQIKKAMDSCRSQREMSVEITIGNKIACLSLCLTKLELRIPTLFLDNHCIYTEY